MQWRSAQSGGVGDLFKPPGESFWNNYQTALNFFKSSVGGSSRGTTPITEVVMSKAGSGEDISLNLQPENREGLLKLYKDIGPTEEPVTIEGIAVENVTSNETAVPEEKEALLTPVNSNITENFTEVDTPEEWTYFTM